MLSSILFALYVYEFYGEWTHREAEYGATSQGGFEPKISGLVLPATALQSNTGNELIIDKPLKQYCGEPDYIGFLAVPQRSLSSKNVKKVSSLCNTI